MLIRCNLAGVLTLALAIPVAGVALDGDPQALATPAATIRDSPAGEVFGAAIGTDGTSYLVGSFTQAGAAAANVSRLDSNAVVNRSFPTTNGKVYSVVPAPGGGWFIGGTFTQVDNEQRANLALITSAGTVDPNWSVPVTGTQVLSMMIVDDSLIIGGVFSHVGGESRENLAAININTKAVLSWAPNPDIAVNAVVADDSAVYVGGNFTSINFPATSPVQRSCAAAFNRSTLSLSTWNPSPNAVVTSLATAPGKVYVGGGFISIGGQSRNRLAAVKSVSTDDSAALSWNPDLDGSVRSVALDDTLVFVGGDFTHVNNGAQFNTGPQVRQRVAAFSTDDTGTATAWNPNSGSSVYAVLPTSAGVFIGGTFSTIGGSPRGALALVDKVNGALQPWDAGIVAAFGQRDVVTLTADGTGVIAGGRFTHVNTVNRNRAAAFDSQGRLTPWDPDLNGNGRAITLKGSTALVAGAFTTVNRATSRKYAAAFRTDDTGWATGWDPDLNGQAWTIALDDTLTYLGGDFTTVKAGITRNRAASFDDTGNVTTWNPAVDGTVRDFAFGDDTAYLVGAFTSVGGASRLYAAAVRTDDTGTITSWNPGPGAEVRAVETAGDIAYLGGQFTTVGGVSRSFTAAVRTDDTGAVTPWAPSISCSLAGCFSKRAVSAIAVAPNTVYLGGYFSSVGGSTSFNSLAAVSPSGTGTPVASWIPTLTRTLSGLPVINTLALGNSGLAVGGDFAYLTLDSTAYPSFATAIPTAPTIPAAPTGVTATPGNASASIAWTPGNDGGASVTRVDIALDDTSQVYTTSANTTSPLTITGLTNGTTYTAYVRLANSAGDSDWSAASAPFTPQASPRPPSPPGPPTQVKATPGNASAAVTWTPPASNGSSPISSYAVTASPGGQTCTTSAATCTVTALTNGTSYTFTVTASSAAGSGPASAPSAPVTPRTIPGPPTAVTATPRDTRATITWSAPTDDGGSTITGYRVTTIPPSEGCTVTATTCTVTGLTNGRKYVVSVVATNAAGSSAPVKTTVTPRGKASIIITGTRARNDPGLVKIRGTVTNLDVATVQPYIRLGRAQPFQPALTQATVDAKDRFRWQRMTSKRITVYVEAAGVSSNKITLPAR